jgi:hypothetical protein
MNLAWTVHLPLNKVMGSHIYLWNGSGCGTAVYIPGGHCLLLRSDVVHSYGVPDDVSVGHKFIRLQVYLPTKSQKPPPLGETIYRTGPDGAYYFPTHWYTGKTSIQDSMVKDKRVAAEKRSLEEQRVAAQKSTWIKKNLQLKQSC